MSTGLVTQPGGGMEANHVVEAGHVEGETQAPEADHVAEASQVGQQAEQRVEQQREITKAKGRGLRYGWVLWPLWVVATVAGGLLGLPVAWGMNRVKAGGFLEWLLAGIILGLAQWPAVPRFGVKLARWRRVRAGGFVNL